MPTRPTNIAGDNGKDEGCGKGGSCGGVLGIMAVLVEKVKWGAVEGMASEVG